ncbi:MAG: hypothetical protein ACYTGG_04710 [Planctomycetota bacterium]|jgi:hypothetical protein
MLVLLAAAAILLPARLAPGQGTMGVLPDPISTSELNGYAARLRLSDQQWQALETIHDEYKAEFRRLREGEINEFLDSMRSIQGSGGFPERDVLEQFLERMEKLTDRIEAIDRRLFDRLVPFLSDDQVAALPRARLARERKRYAQQEMLSMGATLVDLSALLLDIDLEPAERERVDSILQPYEARLTADYGKLAKKASRMWLDMYDAILAQGFDEEAMQDPEQAEKMMEAMQQIMADVAAPMLEMSGKIRERNVRTYRALRTALSREHAEVLRRSFLRRAYPRAQQLAALDVAVFDRLVRHAELADEQARTASELVATAHADFNRITDEAIDALEVSNDGRSPFEPFGNSDELNRTLADLRRQAGARLIRTGEELAALIGDDRLLETVQSVPEDTELMTIVGLITAAEQSAAAQAATAAPAEAESPAEVVPLQVDMLVPRAISATDLDRYAKRLGLDDGDRAIAAEMHRRYREQFDALRGGLLKDLGALAAKSWKQDPRTGQMTGLSDDEIDDMLRRRRAAFRAIEQLDDELFMNLGLAFEDESRAAALERLRQARRRQTYSVPISVASMFDQYGGREALIDLGELVTMAQGLQPSPTQDEALIPYEERLTALLAARFEVALESQRAMDRYMAATIRLQSAGEEASTTDWMSIYRDILGPAARQAEKANDTIIALNADWLPKLVELLPADAASRLHELYRRRAFPNVFGESDVLEQRVATALALPDLTESQRTSLQELSLEYRPALASLNDKLVELSRSAPSMNWLTDGEEMDWQAFQDHQSRIARVQFDRGELNERAAAKLRRILTKDQVARLGGLPEP